MAYSSNEFEWQQCGLQLQPLSVLWGYAEPGERIPAGYICSQRKAQKKTVVSEHERHRQAMLWTQSHWQRQWRVSRVDSVKGVFYLCVCVRVEGVRSRWSRRDSCKGEVKCACVCVCPAVSFIFLQLRQYITHADSTEPQEVQKCDTRLQNSAVFCIQVQ